jgi:ATP-dependent DNA helicase RecG
MFDRDLQEVIRAENKGFIDQALERAAAAEAEPERIVLTELETSVEAAQISDFSAEALEEYRVRASITDPVKSAAFTRRLVRQGVLEESDGQTLPTGFGILLFGQEPRAVIHHAGLLGTIHYPDRTHETREFDKPLVLIPDLIEEWLRNKLPNVIDRDQMRRAEVPPLPFEMVREAVVNALVHRDYAITGAKCQLVVDEHTIVVKSPGKPPLPVTVEQLQKFNAPMLSRNPGLHYVFAKMEMAEESGLGIQSLRSQATQAGLPLPKYTFNDPYLELTLYRSPESASLTLAPQILAELGEDARMAWQFIMARGSVTTRGLMKELGFPERKSQRVLSNLIEAKLVRRVGAGRATHYEVIQR